MTERLRGITAQQQHELQTMLTRLSALWAELTAAAENSDQARVDAVNAEIALCRKRVDEIKRAGTQGSA